MVAFRMHVVAQDYQSSNCRNEVGLNRQMKQSAARFSCRSSPVEAGTALLRPEDVARCRCVSKALADLEQINHRTYWPSHLKPSP